MSNDHLSAARLQCCSKGKGWQARSQSNMVNRWIRDSATALARAGGFTPTGTHWLERIKHLHGEFRPSPRECFVLGAVAAGSASACAMVAFGLTNELGPGFLTDAVWLDVAMIVIFAAFSLLFLYFLGRRYIFDGGSVLCIWGNGRELKLQWPKHSRRIQLFDGIRMALDSDTHDGADNENRAQKGRH